MKRKSFAQNQSGRKVAAGCDGGLAWKEQIYFTPRSLEDLHP
jgi:hypothetical protein